MNDSIDRVLDWLRARPFQDNPAWLAGASQPAPGSWDEWLAQGREIADGESGLLRLLANDKDPVNRSAAALALGFVGGEQCLAPLLASLAGDLPLVAMEAAAALGRLRRPGAMAPLCAALSHRDANVRASACTALGAIGGELASSCLAAARDDSDPLVRSAAGEALSRLAPPSR
jgi:HEAT repeat protein